MNHRYYNICSKLRKNAERTLEKQLDMFFPQKKQFVLHETQDDYAELDFWTMTRLDSEQDLLGQHAFELDAYFRSCRDVILTQLKTED